MGCVIDSDRSNPLPTDPLDPVNVERRVRFRVFLGLVAIATLSCIYAITGNENRTAKEILGETQQVTGDIRNKQQKNEFMQRYIDARLAPYSLTTEQINATGLPLVRKDIGKCIGGKEGDYETLLYYGDPVLNKRRSKLVQLMEDGLHFRNYQLLTEEIIISNN